MGYMNKRLMFSAALMMVLLSANAQVTTQHPYRKLLVNKA